MRSAVLVGALLGLAAATPLAKRQDMDFDVIDAADPADLTTPPVDISADPGSYDAVAAASSAAADPVTTGTSDSKVRVKRGDCDAEPTGYGPIASPDTPDAFLADKRPFNAAKAAVQPTGYTQMFMGLNTATESSTYITYKTLTAYDPAACASFCDSVSSCYFFNLFMERDPSISPADACPNPPSTTYYKCSLFGAKQTNATATNKGGWRAQFHAVIAGSNGYNKNAVPAAQPDFQGPTTFAGAINAPDNSYMGAKYYNQPYDPALCAAACKATTAYNSRHPAADGSYNTCSFFNAYVLNINYVPQGTYCSLYSKTWDPTYAKNMGQYRGSDWYGVSQSYGYTLAQV